MVARQPQVGANEGDQQYGEAQNGQPGRPPAPPAHGKPLMQAAPHRSARQTGSGPLWGPRTRSAKGVLGVQRAHDNARGEQRKTDGEAPIVKRIQLRQGRQAPVEEAKFLALSWRSWIR